LNTFLFNNQRPGNPEATTFGNMFREVQQLFGWDVIYLAKNYFNELYATGEFQTKVVENATFIRCILKQQEGFERSDMFTKFGYFPNDYADLFVSKSTLQQYNITLQAGDLIYIPITTKIFEIENYSDRDSSDLNFYLGGENPGYHLSCKLYYPDSQPVNTNITPVLPNETSLQSTPLDPDQAQIDINNIMELLNINTNLTENNNTNIQTQSAPNINNSEIDPLDL